MDFALPGRRQTTGAAAHSQAVRALLLRRLRLRAPSSLVRLGLLRPVRPLLLALVPPFP